MGSTLLGSTVAMLLVVPEQIWVVRLLVAGGPCLFGFWRLLRSIAMRTRWTSHFLGRRLRS